MYQYDFIFFGGHNSEFSEQSFAYKSEHNKRILQRDSGRDFAYSLLKHEKELGEFELVESYF